MNQSLYNFSLMFQKDAYSKQKLQMLNTKRDYHGMVVSMGLLKIVYPLQTETIFLLGSK